MEPAISEDVGVFLGDKEAYYTTAWSKRGLLQWNWAAFVFSGSWLLYRKMIRPAAVLYGLLLSVNLWLHHHFLSLVGLEEVPRSAELIEIAIMATFLGVFGNRLYYRYTQRRIQEIRIAARNLRETKQLLMKAGGTSVLYVVLGSVGYIVASRGVQVLWDLLWHG